MPKSATPLAPENSSAAAAPPGIENAPPAANGSTNTKKSTKGGDSSASASTSASASASTSSSTLGPGPRRFRGDVPAFNPSNSSPHLYAQQSHQYMQQPPVSSPMYPAQHAQYFTQQPQFIPYGSSMMPYYPVAMPYPDYSMYQPYQYYTVPAGQFQAPQAYMPINGMTNGTGNGGNGYVSSRKKHFKNQYSHNNHNQHYNHHNNTHIPNGINYGQSGGSYHSHSKHSSPSSHSLNLSTETSETSQSRDKEVNNTESVPRIDDPEPPALIESTKNANDESSLVASEKSLQEALEKSDPASRVVAADEVENHDCESTHKAAVSASASSQVDVFEDMPQGEPPHFFNITLEELIEGKQKMIHLGEKLFKSKSLRLENFYKDAESSDMYWVDSKSEIQIRDYNKSSEYTKTLRPRISQNPNKTNEHELNDNIPPKPSLNWASLLQSTAKKPSRISSQIPPAAPTFPKAQTSTISSAPISSDRYQSLGLLIFSTLYDPSFDLEKCKTFALKPRGLTNTGNICYMNAVLQCLIYCPPFSKILRLVDEKLIGQLGKSSLTPVLDATINFMNDFANVVSTSKSSGSSLNSGGIVVGRPLSPETLYTKLVETPKFQHLKWGQQEDAEEFLVYLLDGLHEDFVKAEATVTPDQIEQLIALYSQKTDSTSARDLRARIKRSIRLLNKHGNDSSDSTVDAEDEQSENGWSEVGGRRKVSSKRVSEVEPSPITSIFGGRFRSVLTVPKAKETHSITIDPYRCISLDVSSEEVETIEDALRKLNEIEKLPFKTEAGLEVTAQKQAYIEDLPEVLTLQLKRFSFEQKSEQLVVNGSDSKERDSPQFHGVGTIEKVLKNVVYGLDLTIPLESLSPAAKHSQNRDYSLTGVIYHHGRHAEGGHYTCDVLRGDENWLRIDDTAVEPIDADAVTEKPEAKDKSAYILIYQRKSAI